MFTNCRWSSLLVLEGEAGLIFLAQVEGVVDASYYCLVSFEVDIGIA